MRRSLVGLALMGAASLAHADEECPATPAHQRLGGIDFHARDGIWARRDEGELQLATAKIFCRIDRLTNGRIRISTRPPDSACSDALITTDYSTSELSARIADDLGMKRLRQKDYAGAVSAFRNALAHDPSSDRAMTNLACALNRGGQREAAVASLVTLAARNRPLVLHKLATDPDLQTLSPAPAIASLRANGTVTLDATHDWFRDAEGRHRRIAIQPKMRWLAAIDVASSCCADADVSTLLLLDADGKQLTSVPLGCRGEECDTKTDGRPLANRLLRELGFVIPVDAVELERDPNSEEPVTRKAGGLEIALISADELEVRNGKHVQTLSCPTRVIDATYVPSFARLVCRWSNRNMPEGCSSPHEYSGVNVLRVAPASRR